MHSRSRVTWKDAENYSVLGFQGALATDRLFRRRIVMAPQAILDPVWTGCQADGRFLFFDRDTGSPVGSQHGQMHDASLSSSGVVPSRAHQREALTPSS
ncbi:hypothetical protein WN48_01137 [Eufriesea mexicana]|nr:hypothetical protein WN48_01137 [Eufriesea mexicana]